MSRSQECVPLMARATSNCRVVIVGAGPYGLASAAYLRAAGVETRVFGEPMSFWENQMPAGMCLRSSWEASHIADPEHRLTLDHYGHQNENHIPKPIPLERFVQYGHWYQESAVPNLERRIVKRIDCASDRFRIMLDDGEEFSCRQVVIAAGISSFAHRPVEFSEISSSLVSHTSEHNDLRKFKGQRILVIGGGQSALESAALLKEAGIDVEVIVRQQMLNWVGLHPKLHRLGVLSSLLYSKRDVGPAGISRLVAAPNLFRLFPREFQNRASYRAIRPAGAGWLQPRLKDVQIRLGRSVTSVTATDSRISLKLDDGSARMVDHVLLATGFRVDVARYPFLSESLLQCLKTVSGFPVLKRGLECSIPGLHFVGKPAAWSFGPVLGFVSGAEISSKELIRSITRKI